MAAFGSTGYYHGVGAVSRLYIAKKTKSGSVQIYGPFGASTSQSTFAVVGEIKSIFGRYGGLLDSIGFYFEEMDSTC